MFNFPHSGRLEYGGTVLYAATPRYKSVPDRTPVFEPTRMWEIEHIRRPPGRIPRAVFCPMNDAA